MKVTPIGVGQAGGKIVDQLASHDEDAELGVVVDGLVVNSSRADLVGLRHLPQDRRVLVGQAEVNGHGVGRDNERGANVMNDDIEDVIYRLEETDFEEQSDAFFLVGGLGGGMGSGGLPVLAKYLHDRYDLPVYTVGVLPSMGEGHLASLNAMRSLNTLVHLTESVILFDNDAWIPDDNTTLEESYSSMNEQLITSLVTLFAATEPSGGGPVGEQVIDAEDLKATFGAGDISTIGYADAELQRESVSFLSKILGKKGDVPDDTSAQVETVIQEATLGRLTAPASLSHIEAVLGVVAGPKDFLSQKGLEDASVWLDEETSAEQLRTGDFPVEDDDEDHDYMAGMVVLSGLSVVERLIELYDRVVGLDTLAGMDNVEVEATDVMEAFFIGDKSPDPLFVTDEYDPTALRVVGNELDYEEPVGREGVDEFDWRMEEMDENTEPDDVKDVNASAEVFQSEDVEESMSAAEAETPDGDDETDAADDEDKHSVAMFETEDDDSSNDSDESHTDDANEEDTESEDDGDDENSWFGETDGDDE